MNATIKATAWRPHWLIVLLLGGLLLTTACTQEEAAPEPTPTTGSARPATGAMMPTSTPPPEPTPTSQPTATPEPTPIPPSIAVSDQRLTQDGRLAIDAVMAPEPGWLAVYTSDEGERGALLAHTAVPAGVSEAISLTLDVNAAVPSLTAVLHTDQGETDTFEFPGPDEPVQAAGDDVAANFTVDLALVRPAVTIEDQEIGEEGAVAVTSVYTPAPAWLALHADDAGALGPLLAYTPLEVGLTEAFTMTIPWRQSTPLVRAVLYEGETDGRFDPAVAEPVVVQGEMVEHPFSIVYPPDMMVLNQPIIDGEITIERVISDGPGWVVVHYDDEGQLGLIIGYAPLVDGINEQIQVPLVETAVTPELFIMLHHDTGAVGEFDYPPEDPVRTYNERIMTPAVISVRPGNYLITQDQPLSENGDTFTVTIPYIVTDLDAWVVIRAQQEEQQSAILGRAWLPAGVNRDVAIELDENLPAGATLYAILHIDADPRRVFEYPDGPDVPLQRNRTILQSPFTLTPP